MFKLKMVDNGTKDVQQLTAAGRACDMVGNSWHLEGTPGGPTLYHPSTSSIQELYNILSKM